MSTSSSGRSAAGKNWFCTKPRPTTDSANNTTATPIVIQRQRIAGTSSRPNHAFSRDGASAAVLAVRGNSATPSNGVNSTATTQEISSEEAITANRVKVYSPAELLLRPIGTKPATVTKVPVSIGKAVEV